MNEAESAGDARQADDRHGVQTLLDFLVDLLELTSRSIHALYG